MVVYFDDILMHSRSEKEHVKHLRAILKSLKQNKLYLNLKKFEFATTRLLCLGFIISLEGIYVNERKVEYIRNWPQPVNICNVRVSIG